MREEAVLTDLKRDLLLRTCWWGTDVGWGAKSNLGE